MSDKREDGLDAALAALVRAERAARPKVSDGLRARVLADAADVAATRPAKETRPATETRPAAAPSRPAGAAGGWLGWVRGLDVWAGAAVAAAILCLAIGLGVGYEAGDRVLAEAGFEDMRVAQTDEDAAALLAEDVL